MVLLIRIKGKGLRRKSQEAACSCFSGLQSTLEPDITSLARAKWSIKLFYRPLHEGAWGEEGRAQGRPAGQGSFSHLISNQKLQRTAWREGEDNLSSLGLLYQLSMNHPGSHR